MARNFYWIGFFGVIALAWAVLYRMSGMAGVDLIGRPVGANSMGPPGFATLFGMWALMMAAMMLPTMVPTLRAYEDLMVAADATRLGWSGVILGYLGVWLLFAAGIAAAQLQLREWGVIDTLGLPASGWIAAFLLVAVGIYQFTRLKHSCHSVCHAPTMYFLRNWRPDFGGGLRMGSGLGGYCVGCCWGFMALGFVGGTMNLLWMGLATFFMILEKLPQVAHRVVRPVGALLILSGLGAAGASLLGIV